jgi:serine/threonine-protein kinase
MGLHEVEDAVYVVTEYMEGRSLDEIYTDTLLCGSFCSEHFVLYLAAELASALHAAHTCTDARGQPLGIVHRDLHPDRIRLGTQGQVKLGGFGLATSHQDGRRASSLPRAAGPVIYAAPEQLLNRSVEPRSDLFSLGLVMMELLTGHHLYRIQEDVDLRRMGLDMAALPSDKLRLIEATIAELGRLHDEGVPRTGLAQLAEQATSFDSEDVERLAREVPEPTRLILHKLLRQDPEERYRSAAELETALRERLKVLEPYGAREAAEEVFLLQVEASGLTLLDLAEAEAEAEPGPEPESAPLPERTEEELTTQPS